MKKEWLTTSAAASMLGVSRQHVVDLCERGELSFTTAGTHRRIHPSEIQRLLGPQLTREQEKSLWLHRALLGRLMIEPTHVLEIARENINRWTPGHRTDGMAVRYLEQWAHAIDDGVDEVAIVLTGTDERSIEMRQNSPFAGVLTDAERRQVLRAFREHWDREHSAA